MLPDSSTNDRLAEEGEYDDAIRSRLSIWAIEREVLHTVLRLYREPPEDEP